VAWFSERDIAIVAIADRLWASYLANRDQKDRFILSIMNRIILQDVLRRKGNRG